MAVNKQPRILVLGQKPSQNLEVVERLYQKFDVVTTTKAERERFAFLQNLRDRTWGDFDGILCPYWYEGHEMEPFDEELIALLPKSLKVHASMGAGYDWMNIPEYTKKGTIPSHKREWKYAFMLWTCV